MMPFHPMVDGDVLSSTPAAALAAGAAAGVALVAGTTADEMRLFVDSAGGARASRQDHSPARRALSRRRRDRERRTSSTATRPRLGTDDTNEIWRALFGDNEMQRRAARCSRRTRRTVRRTRTASRGRARRSASCHGIDIPFPFGNFVDGWDAFVGLDDDGRALSSRDARGVGRRSPAPAIPVGRSTPRRASSDAPITDAAQHPLFGRLPTLRDRVRYR